MIIQKLISNLEHSKLTVIIMMDSYEMYREYLNQIKSQTDQFLKKPESIGG